VRQLNDPCREFVSKDTDRENLGRQSTGNVIDLLRRHLTRRGRKDKSDCVGTHGDRQQSVIFVGNATDLDEHQVAQRTCRQTVGAGSML
jgi:hypothetical protein